MIDAAERLRALHRTPPILVLPNAWDAASARLFVAEGFPAVATTSAGVAASLGYPDGGAVPAREMFEAVARIARAVPVPVTADIEHAYAESPAAVADNVLRVIAAGADCVFVPGVRDPETIRALVTGIGGPINVLAVAGAPSIPELEALGVARVSVGSGPMRATLALVRDIARELKSSGTYSAFTT